MNGNESKKAAEKASNKADKQVNLLNKAMTVKSPKRSRRLMDRYERRNKQ